MNAPEPFTLQMTRFIRAPRDKVFAAFTTEALGQRIDGFRPVRLDQKRS